MENKNNGQIKLVKDEAKYKLTVTKSLEDKIRYLCAMFNDREYSGALFYKVEGSFNDNSLNIVCVDFCLCDIGTSTYTEFETKPEVISYMCNNDLLDCYIGLLHSHNRMGSFFSGTDTDTLKSEGMTMPHFVSLIVNNKGEYTAAITSRVTRWFRGTVDESVDAFGGGTESSTAPVEKSFSDVCVRYNYLDITVERDSWFDDIRDKIDSINREKSASNKKDLKMYYDTPVQLKMFDTDDFEDFETSDVVMNPVACERIIKKTLCPDKQDGSITDYVREFLKNGKTSNTVLKKRMLSLLKKECGSDEDSLAFSNLCNDLTLFIEDYDFACDNKLMADKVNDVLNRLFDIIIEIMGW